MTTNMTRGMGMALVLGGLMACSGEVPRHQFIPTTGEAGVTGTSSGLGGNGVPQDDGLPTPPASGIAGSGFSCGPDGKPLPIGAPRGSDSLSLPAEATRATKPVPAISGGTLLALSDGKTAVAADPDRDRVYVVDLGTNTVRSTIMLAAGDQPGRVIEDGGKRVHVALRGGGAVITIDPATGTLGARRSVCSAPRGLVYQATGDQVHVACAGGELVSLPAAGGAATRTLMLERDLRDVVVGAKDSLMVSTFRRADVLIVQKDGTPGVRLKPASGMGSGIAGPPRHMSPGVAWRMVPLGDGAGSVLMLHQTAVDDVINPSGGGYGGVKGCGAIVEAGVSILTPGAASPAQAVGFEMVSMAVDVALSPDKTQFAIAVPANMATSFATVVSGPITSVMSPAPTGPGAPCIFLNSSTVNSPPQNQEFVAVSYTASSVLLAQTREPATLWRSDTGTSIVLSTESRADTGHLLFHANAGGGLACASCHPEGGEDGRTWNFACQGARRTQSIRGGISGTAPFHWDGDETSFAKLMDDVFVQRMSGPSLSPEFKDALAGWIDTIPALPAATGLDAAAVARGKLVFNDTKVACATCHAGGLMTNNTTVDVGTGHAVQVPSLRGLSWRAPYMHDGCAGTLADRFGVATCGGGDKHGATSQLMPTELADLTTYLQSL